MSDGTFGNPRIVEEDLDILLIGGGMACCGAAYEMMRWAEAAKAETGVDLKIKLVDKAAMDRSGAVAQGLSAINTYIGPDMDPADYARMVSNDLMGITRDDLAYDVGRHVDESVHLFEEWGLPIWKTDADGVRHDGAESQREGLPSLRDGGKPVRSGKWQIMINGESYKWIVAEAAKKALGLDRIAERVFIVKLVNDKNDPSRIAGAVGFSVRDNTIYIYKAKAILLAAGGCVNLFRPRSVGEGTGRAWYPVWNAGSTYAMAAEAGAEMTMMENRFVPARFKDGYGPVGAWFLLFKAKATNAYGEDYMVKNKALLDDYPPYGQAAVPASCLRNHLMLKEMKEGRGPIYMDTVAALARLRESLTPKEVKHLESEAWEDFLDMCIGQCGIWAGENVEPDKKNSELMPTEPYLLGSHSGCCGIWVSGPEDLGAPTAAEGDYDGVPAHLPRGWNWGYRSMTTVKGLFTAGDGVGASGHKFSSGSHAEGRLAAQGDGQVRARPQGLETRARYHARAAGGGDLQAGAHVHRAQELHDGDRHQSALHHAQDAAVPAAEDHGRVCGRLRDLLQHQRQDAGGRRGKAGDAEGRRRQDARQGPARAACAPGRTTIGSSPPKRT